MLNEVYRVLTPTGVYVCISHGAEVQRKKYLKDLKRFNWRRYKHMIQKPGIGQNVRELKIPKDDDPKNFHFVYCLVKKTNPVRDSDDEEF